MLNVNKNDPLCVDLLKWKIDVDEMGIVTYRETGKELSRIKSPSGYLRVQVHVDGVAYRLVVHRLVMIKYHGTSHLEVDHINDDKLDCRLSNLRYITRSENTKNLKRHIGGRILTDQQVEEAREKRKYGTSIGELAREYGISHTAMKRRLSTDYICPFGVVGLQLPGVFEKSLAARRANIIHYKDGIPMFLWCQQNGVKYNTELSRRKKENEKNTGTGGSSCTLPQSTGN